MVVHRESPKCEKCGQDVEGFLEAGEGSPVEVTFETVLMTDEEFAALPEFDGY